MTVADAGSPISPPAGAPVANVRHGLTLATYRKGTGGTGIPGVLTATSLLLLRNPAVTRRPFTSNDGIRRVGRTVHQAVGAAQADFSATADGRYVLVARGRPRWIPELGRLFPTVSGARRSDSRRTRDARPLCGRESVVLHCCGNPPSPRGTAAGPLLKAVDLNSGRLFGNVCSEPRKNRRPRNCVHDWCFPANRPNLPKV